MSDPETEITDATMQPVDIWNNCRRMHTIETELRQLLTECCFAADRHAKIRGTICHILAARTTIIESQRHLIKAMEEIRKTLD